MKTTPKIFFFAAILLLVTACGLPGLINPTSAPAIATPTSGQPSSNGSSETQPAVTSPPVTSNSPTLTPPSGSPSGASPTDKTEPNLTNVNTSVAEAYYHDNGCGPTSVTVSADVSDDSGKISSVWADYQYVSMSAGVGGNEWYRVELYPVGNNHYEGVIDLTLKADGELQGNDGTLQYQVYAMDAAGNTKVVPEGFIYGVTALSCFPQVQPPGGGNNPSGPVTISHAVTYPVDSVYYGNCTTEETSVNFEVRVGPESLISSITMYYTYTDSNGATWDYSSPMSLLGIGDYSGDVNVGIEAPALFGDLDGIVVVETQVIDVDGNIINSNGHIIQVKYCPGAVLPPPPEPPTIATGSGTLYNSFSLDLGDGNGDDIIFIDSNSGGLQLLSVWGTELQVNPVADIATCKLDIGGGDTFATISIDPLDAVCYKTGSGNYGYLIINGMGLDLDDPSNSYVDIYYETEVMP